MDALTLFLASTIFFQINTAEKLLDQPCFCNLNEGNNTCFLNSKDTMYYQLVQSSGPRTQLFEKGIITCWNTTGSQVLFLNIFNNIEPEKFVKGAKNPAIPSDINRFATQSVFVLEITLLLFPQTSSNSNSSNIEWLEPYSIENVSSAVLKSLANPNHLQTFKADGFSIELENNTFEKITNLRSLTMVNTNITSLPPLLLKHLRRLKKLDLSRNKLEAIGDYFFQFQTDLRFLNLSGNQFKILGDCDNLQCKNPFIHSSNFLKFITYYDDLDFSHNQISEIRPNFFFPSQAQFPVIHLQFNNLTSLANVFDEEDEKLRYLDVSHNKLTILSETDIWALSRLIYLDVSSNHLTLIHKRCFDNLKYLADIYLQNNFLHFDSDISTPIFPFSTGFLNLSHNQLHSVFPENWIRFEQLNELDLSNNHITYFNVEDFLGLNPKQGDWATNIHLQYNNIKTIHFVDFQQIPIDDKLKKLIFHLNSNPIRCDCRMKWLLKTLDQTRSFRFSKSLFEISTLSFKIDQLICNEPNSVRNLPFKEIPERHFLCSSERQCPMECSCVDLMEKVKDIAVSVDCRNANFNNIPAVIPSGTVVLKLDFNPLLSLKTLSNPGFSSLMELGLKSSIDDPFRDERPFKNLISLNKLYLSSNGFDKLPGDYFHNLKNLTELDLSLNKLIELPIGIFDELTKLERLNLENNNLNSFPNDFLRTNPSIQILQLSWNNFHGAINLVITHLINLHTLDLRNNQIRSIDNLIWPGNVKRLLLNSNQIYQLDFNRLPANLQYLDCGNNSLTNLYISDLLIFKSSININLQSNLIQHVYVDEIEKFGIMRSAIQLNSNPFSCDKRNVEFLEYIQKPQYDKLNFGVKNLYCSNPIFLRGKLFESLNESDLLVKEFTGGSNCQSYKSNEEKYKILECVGEFGRSQSGKFRILELYAKDGPMSCLIDLKLEPVWKNLRVIKIRNFISSLNFTLSKAFGNQRDLISLTLTQCQIKSIKSDLLSNLTKLLNLDLSSNEIRELPENLLSNSTQLKIINVSHNAIDGIPDGLLIGIYLIEILDFSFNRIEHFGSFLPPHQPNNLREIYFQNNQLKSLDSKLFSNCHSLLTLDLSNNLLTSDRVNQLVIPSGITGIKFSRNRLHHFDAISWSILRSLQILDLSFNNITTIDIKQIQIFPKQSTIYLNDNNISLFSWNVLPEDDAEDEDIAGGGGGGDSFNEGNVLITLTNNPLNCDCNIKSLVQFIRKEKFDVQISIGDDHLLKCHSPDGLKNSFLKDVTIRDLRCNLDDCPLNWLCYHSSFDESNYFECSDIHLAHLPTISRVNYAIDVLVMNGNEIESSVNFKDQCWKNLKKVIVESCKIKGNLTGDFLINQVKLIELRLVGDELKYIPNSLLQNATELEILDLSRNFLKSVSHQLVGHLEKLKILDISHNLIEFFDDYLLMTSLESLNLAGNRIHSIFIPTQSPHFRLKFFNVSYNSLRTLEKETNSLYKLKNLEVLDLTNNRISFDCDEKFLLPLSLRILNISQNHLKCIHFANWTRFTRLEFIDISYNQIPSIDLKHLAFGNNSNVLVHCRHCNLKNSSLNLLGTRRILKNSLTIDISHNDIECLCDLTRFYSPALLHNQNFTCTLRIINNFQCYFEDKEFEKVASADSDDTQPMCKVLSNCPKECLCLKPDFTPDTTRIAMDCRNKNLRAIPTVSPRYTTYLNLDDNKIIEVKGFGESQWENMTHVSLRNNQIKNISDENWPRFLKVIRLDGNKLETPNGWLKELVINDESFPFNMSLGNNEWNCECDDLNIKFQNLLRNDESKNSIADRWNITCPDGKAIVDSNICPDVLKKHFVVILASVLAISTIMIALAMSGLFFYKNKSAVLVWLYSKRICWMCVGEEDLDVDKEYDAFVSYAHEDVEFVQNVLVPSLEVRQPRYKLCIHERDWMPGENILDQIWTSIEKSRRIIIVLSDNFVNSTWAMTEFQLAISKCVEDRFNRIIVIVLDEDFEKNRLDPQLKLYVSMNTYLKRNDAKFLEKLLYAMPHKLLVPIQELPLGNNEVEAIELL